jgi:hypothetical protein
MSDPNSRDDNEIFEAELVEPWLPAGYPRWEPPAAAPVFHVPTRFSISAILGITTALAILFGILRATGAPVVSFWFFSLLSLVICVVQMRFGEVPRQGSIIAGAVLLPLFVLAGMYLENVAVLEAYFIALFFTTLAGAFLGYVTGTCLGGIFLLMDLFEKFWTRSVTHPPSRTSR